MADEPKPNAAPASKETTGTPDAAAAAKPKAGPPIVLIATLAGALIAGGAGGAFLVGPRIVAARNAKPAPHKSAESADNAESGDGKKGDSAKHGVYKIDNLIVNPAGSQGTRFLMATVAIEVPDEKLALTLKERDVQLRDAVIAALEGETLDQLTRPGARDTVKARVARAVAPLTRDVKSLRVYLPQFVIQ